MSAEERKLPADKPIPAPLPGRVPPTAEESWQRTTEILDLVEQIRAARRRRTAERPTR